MVQKRGPGPLPQGELLASLDWLVDDAVQPQRAGLFSRASLDRLLGAAPRWFVGQVRTPSRATLLYALGLAVMAALAAWLLWQGGNEPKNPTAKQVAPPRIESPFAPGAMRDFTREQALAWNAAADKISTSAAASFVIESPLPTDYQRSVECLAQAIHYEAATEGIDGGRAVAQVVLNRVRHPAYPDTVCGVVYEGAKRATGCQFTFACDGSLARTPSPSAWRRARAIAISALAGDVYAPVGWSTHYHANYVVPYWAASLEKTASVGAHIFYRWTGNWGEARAFSRRYAGNEPLAALLLGAAEVTDGAAADQATAQDVPQPLTEARPVLITPAPGVISDDAGRAAVREVDLGDRQVLLPRSAQPVGQDLSTSATER